MGRVVGQRVARFETEIDEQSNRGNDVRTEASIVGTSVVHQCVGMIEMRMGCTHIFVPSTFVHIEPSSLEVKKKIMHTFFHFFTHFYNQKESGAESFSSSTSSTSATSTLCCSCSCSCSCSCFLLCASAKS